MADDISLVVGVDYKELTGLIKTSEQSKRVLKSVAQEFAKTGDQKAYMRGVMQVVMAQKNLDTKTRKTQSEIMKLGYAMRQQAVFSEALRKTTDRTAKSIEQQGKIVGATKNRMNGTNMAIQQLGYQFGDFAVQVQGGTSAFVAFSQQGSQLAGILPMIAGPLGISMGLAVGLSSAFGILIPIGSALARTFFDVGKAADKSASDFKDALSKFESVSEDLSEVMKISLTSPLKEAKGELRSLFETYKQIKAEVAKDALATSLMPIVESVGDVLSTATRKKETTEKLNIGTGQEAVARRVQRLSGLVDIQLEAAKILNLINDAVQGPTEDLASNMLKVAKALRDSEVITHGVKDDFLEIIASSGILAKIQKGYSEEQRAGLNSVKLFYEYRQRDADAARKLAEAVEEIKKKQEDLNREAGLLESSLQREISMLLVKNKFGEKSLAVKKLELEQQESVFKESQGIFEIEKLREGYSQKIVDGLLLQRRVAFYLKRDLQGAADASREIARLAAMSDKEYQQMLYGQAYAQSRMAAPKTPVKGKKKPVVKESDLEKLQKRLDLEEALVGKTETQKVLLQELGVNYEKIYGSDSIGKLEIRIEKLRQIAEEEARVADLANTIGSAMEDSLMSMVDGTKSVKDAFRDMAADIVRHLYKVLVVQQMINAFGGMLSGSSNASIAKIGGALESYDNGGYTGNGPRSGGLDGKGGFMAIMHPRETVVDHTKGQQANINGPKIVQNFNFSANGDDSVKKIIAQAAPQIAQMTKNSMLNDRRRGGTAKAVFG